MDNLKIDFFIVDHTPIGGVQRVTSKLVNLFLLNNIKIDYLISQYNNFEKPHFFYPDKIKYINLNCSKNIIEDQLYDHFVKLKIKNLIFSGDNMSISIALLKAAKRANVIAIPQYHGSPHAYLDKYITTEDMLNEPFLVFKYLLGKIQRPLKLKKLKKYLLLVENGIACVSYGAAKEIKQIFNESVVIKNRVFTIYNPLTFDVNKIVCDVSLKKNHIVYVSRLEKKHKNSFLIVKTWNEIHSKYPDWELHIIGDGSIGNKMKNYATQNNLKNIFFHGMVKEVEKYLEKSKISVLTSNCEGLGMGVLESICYKNAIVTTHSDGGISDLVQHEVSGLLSPRNDHKALAKNIEVLLNDESLREQFVKKSYEILDNFSNEKIIDQWKQHFNRD